jgi:hypothetical protein
MICVCANDRLSGIQQHFSECSHPRPANSKQQPDGFLFAGVISSQCEFDGWIVMGLHGYSPSLA